MRASSASARDALSSCSRNDCYRVGVAQWANKTGWSWLHADADHCQFIDRHPRPCRTKFCACRRATEYEKNIIQARKQAIKQLGGKNHENSHPVETRQGLSEPKTF